MDQAGIIRDLLSWLETHLDQPLSLDNVAAKAGYSKWHLQRMFKDVTNNAIGAYIRARRLSKAAVALRLTSRPILDIALQYRFDSQQTFTRAFKKQFAQTPALYRRSEDWHSFGICPPIRLGAFILPQAEFLSLPEKHLIGVTQSYSCTLEQITTYRNEMREHFWRQYIGEDTTLPPLLYGLHHSRPSQEKDDEQEVMYTTAIEPSHLTDNISEGQEIVLNEGEYALFRFKGSPEGLQEFILTLYGTCLPMLKLIRRKGQDIERFHTQRKVMGPTSPTELECDYLIPIRR
ncbi:MAG: MDR efflux pump AcrAB transcriptional activator RobA [Rouxiella aceris]|jgi:AraC family transcriptional activator of mar-sox-rob regulon|uniref:MDR efflux pump AcrAB transcriptional activator RobA n=1 Tax=Rouxiella aceris TaxID=2703884 RepID=A0A848ML76_9GAMM|nr:MDR efflux pump AcrAB transcriptional activator RobA [Rouxiella aceris]MDR3433542.1 MDR efflux pump AcrAB transcriptional activator RobA [Rouxiella aceris]NMP27682.1 MDR efflux pump AcrAB transcriptional activator RobA [Rouxiella aceris]